MSKYLFVLSLLMAHPARAQVSSGTIVIFNFSKDQVVVAADSLSRNGDTGIPDYSHCKIATFGHQLIFTTVGNSGWSNVAGTGPVQTWDNIELARDAIHLNCDGCAGLDSIAARWAIDVKSHWDFIDRLDRQRAIKIATASYGQIAAGVFIGKGLNTKVALIEYNMSKLIDPVEIKMGNGNDLSDCWPCGQLEGRKICGAGRHLDIAIKFCSERKHGDRISARTPLKDSSESTKLAVKIVEMTVDAYEKTAGDVGGNVDAVTETYDGAIIWNSRKPNCPENQD